MSLWLAISAGIAFCAAALFESVRPTSIVRGRSVALAVALTAGAAVAFSVAGLAAKRDDKPATPVPAPASYFDRSSDSYFGKP